MRGWKNISHANVKQNKAGIAILISDKIDLNIKNITSNKDQGINPRGRHNNYKYICILKSRDITLPTKVHLVKAMVFPVVMCGCESWTVKKAEHRRIDAFEL